MKHKGAILFWTNVANAIAFGGMLVSGAVLKWVVPHGGEGRGGGRGQGMSSAWLGLSRHEWGEVHFWISVAVVGLVVLHLALHAGWILTSSRKYLLGGWPRRAAVQRAPSMQVP